MIQKIFAPGAEHGQVQHLGHVGQLLVPVLAHGEDIF